MGPLGRGVVLVLLGVGRLEDCGPCSAWGRNAGLLTAQPLGWGNRETHRARKGSGRLKAARLAQYVCEMRCIGFRLSGTTFAAIAANQG